MLWGCLSSKGPGNLVRASWHHEHDISDYFLCILYPYSILREKNGKGRLYKVLNVGVPIFVAHMVLQNIFSE